MMKWTAIVFLCALGVWTCMLVFLRGAPFGFDMGIRLVFAEAFLAVMSAIFTAMWLLKPQQEAQLSTSAPRRIGRIVAAVVVVLVAAGAVYILILQPLGIGI